VSEPIFYPIDWESLQHLEVARAAGPERWFVSTFEATCPIFEVDSCAEATSLLAYSGQIFDTKRYVFDVTYILGEY